jgi:AraC-like DNA-binding protein
LTRWAELQRLGAAKMSSHAPTPETMYPVAPDVYERLCRAREFIDLCYDLPLNLDQISSQACFSRFHFLRLFREAFAKTPHQYLVERRIEKAKELLTSDQLRVTDICFEVGFQSLGSFSSLFRKSVGQPPVLFREKARASATARRQIPGCFLVMYKLEPTATQPS